MKIEELRLGNKVMVTISNDAGIYEVLGIPAWGMDGCGDGKEPLVMIDRCPKELVPISKLRPVKLTPEILQTAGFEKPGHTLGWDGPMRFNLYANRQGDFIPCYKENIAGDHQIKYLHQLQNVFFALTGTELNK